MKKFSLVLLVALMLSGIVGKAQVTLYNENGLEVGFEMKKLGYAAYVGDLIVISHSSKDLYINVSMRFGHEVVAYNKKLSAGAKAVVTTKKHNSDVTFVRCIIKPYSYKDKWTKEQTLE